MKNIQVIDRAENCSYCVYQVSDETFELIFPENGQDVEFIEDLIDRLGEQKAGEILAPAWDKRLEKRDLVGLHGTLFYDWLQKRKYYPNKMESDLDHGKLQISCANL